MQVQVKSEGGSPALQPQRVAVKSVRRPRQPNFQTTLDFERHFIGIARKPFHLVLGQQGLEVAQVQEVGLEFIC